MLKFVFPEREHWVKVWGAECIGFVITALGWLFQIESEAERLK